MLPTSAFTNNPQSEKDIELEKEWNWKNGIGVF